MMPPESLQPKPGEHEFAPVVRILGKGKTGSRSLDFDEAKYAMQLILQGRVEDVQLGAFLMLLRVKEESATEIAGFVAAVRENISINCNVTADLDWPSYAGKRSQHPWFILSALLLAQNSIKVLMHGSAGHTLGRLYTEKVFKDLKLPVVSNTSDIDEALVKHGIAYLPLERFCPVLQAIIDLRNTLGLRSPVHTLSRLINPSSAKYSMQSVFHPSYAEVHQSASQLLAATNTAVFKGESGEIERKPDANTSVHYQRDSEQSSLIWPRMQQHRQDNVECPSVEALISLWRHADDPYGEQAVIGTAAIALHLCEFSNDIASAENLARRFWTARDRSLL